MESLKQNLGKVSLTTNGLWDPHKTYDRLCLVTDGHFATYLSKKEVPEGIVLSDIAYWQPVGNLRDDIKLDYNAFKEYIQNIIDNIYHTINHLTPEVNWNDVKEEINNVVQEMVEDGDFRVGITSVKSFSDLDKLNINKSGTLVFVVDDNQYYQYYEGQWDVVPIIHIGSDEPKGNVLWVDPNTTDIDGDKDEELAAIKAELRNLQGIYAELRKLIVYGIIPGDATSGTRSLLLAQADPIRPADAPDDIEDEEYDPDTDPDKPDTSWADKSVACVCCKLGEAKDFTANKADLVDGEIVFYTDQRKFAVYYGGGLYVAGTGGSGSSGSTGGGITQDELSNLLIEYLTFYNRKYNYKIFVDEDGVLKNQPFKDGVVSVDQPVTNNVYVSHLLCINSVFCGGDNTEDCGCTHNFVELANGSNNDINLNGIYLLYTDGSKSSSGDVGFIWQTLPLKGIIKAGSTFVIRGAQCTTAKHALINVEGYDMEWRVGRDLIRFNQGRSSFYLCGGDSFKADLENKTLNNPWIAGTARKGYIDSCGFGEGSVSEGSGTFNVVGDWNKILFMRNFPLDPSSQANKAYSARKTTNLMTYINLDKQTENLGNSKQYYYTDKIKMGNRPMASYCNKTFFTNKTTFDHNHPNYLNCLYGIQATDNGSGASRAFNWVSVGNHDEFVEIRKKGETVWNKHYSIIPNDRNNTTAINKFIEYYKRYRWCASDGTWVTTHKCIVKGLTKGTYEYRVGRDNDNNYYSDILEFTVEADADVNTFSFIQVSDQQGFNWHEYTAWWKTSDVIKEREQNFSFLINTGDIAQSGNRVNEWLDYYSGKKAIINKPEMYTVGNNDLCGHDSTVLTNGADATSKYSHINVLRYFCFELDERNEYFFKWGENGNFPIYSLYSFNFGKYHFVSLNSEIAIATSKMYKDWESDTYAGDRTFADTANAFIETWFKKDLQLWKNTTAEPTDCSKCIVFMHEMPFTIVTYDFMNGSAARVGSHLNTLNNNGLYRFSRIFKKYGIRAVFGGHKHTFCISKPIYDAPEGYVNNKGQVQSGVDLMGKLGNNDSNATALSRIPVIQVLKASDVKQSEFARYEVVSKITAPVYVMSQASGYKLVSNKEMPTGPEYRIPWLLAYFPAATSASSPKENVAQHKPMYIRVDCSDNAIKVTANQVENVWDVNVNANTSKFDMNNQLTTLSSTKMTLSTTTNEDKQAYNITNTEYLNIEL